jgi:creatinine amidohydrolase
MQWENLSSLAFATAVAKSQGVGIIPLGVLEAHGAHLPLGTDVFTAHWIATQAAAQETAVVFPAYPFGANAEAAHLPGALVIRAELIMDLLENVCDEMARNGLHKIILISGHGGNRFFLSFFVQMLTARRKPYVVYFINTPYFPPKKRRQKKLRWWHFRRRKSAPVNRISREQNWLDTDEVGHACEWETSLLRYTHEELVHLEQVTAPFNNLRRNQTLAALGVYSQVDWYSMYPDMVVGDPRPATAEKGRIYMETAVANLVRAIQTIKADAITPQLVAEFNAHTADPQTPDSWRHPPSPNGQDLSHPPVTDKTAEPTAVEFPPLPPTGWRTLFAGMRSWLTGI